MPDGDDHQLKVQRTILRANEAIVLRYARLKFRPSVAVLFAPEEDAIPGERRDFELLEDALVGIGVKPHCYDARAFRDVARLVSELPSLDEVLILDNASFALARFSNYQLTWIAEKKRNYFPIVIQTQTSAPAEFTEVFRTPENTIQVDAGTWHRVPLFLIQQILDRHSG